MSEKIHDHRKVYLGVFLALLTLTVITVWVAFHDFGLWNIVVAMGVATIKGSLVCLYFMHLRYDNRLNQVIFIASFVFLAIFVGLTLSDELTRSVEKPGPVAVETIPSR
jgi:cytochrome c oxidase subunit 4